MFLSYILKIIMTVITKEEIDTQYMDLNNAVNSKVFREITLRHHILLKFDPSVMPLLFFFEFSNHHEGAARNHITS